MRRQEAIKMAGRVARRRQQEGQKNAKGGAEEATAQKRPRLAEIRRDLITIKLTTPSSVPIKPTSPASVSIPPTTSASVSIQPTTRPSLHQRTPHGGYRVQGTPSLHQRTPHDGYRVQGTPSLHQRTPHGGDGHAGPWPLAPPPPEDSGRLETDTPVPVMCAHTPRCHVHMPRGVTPMLRTRMCVRAQGNT